MCGSARIMYFPPPGLIGKTDNQMKNSHKLFLLGCMALVALFFVSCNSTDDESESSYSYRIGFAGNLYTEIYGEEVYDEIKDYYVAGMKDYGIGDWDDDDPYLFTLYGLNSACDTMAVHGAAYGEALLEGSGITITFPTASLVIVEIENLEEVYWKTFREGETL